MKDWIVHKSRWHLKKEGAVCYANKLLQYLHELQVVTIDVLIRWLEFE
jgi:hypothetical protein